MYNLFLDDIRTPEQASQYRLLDWVIVKNYDEFVDYITKNGLPELVSFDHDLADIHYDPSTWVESFEYQEETGLDCMRWMINYIQDNKLTPPKMLIHSMNPVGGENIQALFDNFIKLYEK